MKIENNNMSTNWVKGVSSTKNNDIQSTIKKQESNMQDSVTVSQNAIDMNHFLSMMPKDEIRFDKIEAINKQMEEGTYNVTGKEVVFKLLEGK